MSAQPRMLAPVAAWWSPTPASHHRYPLRRAPPQNSQSQQMFMRGNENWDNNLTAMIHNDDFEDDFELPRQVRRKYNQKENRRRREITSTAIKNCRARGGPELSRPLFISRIVSETYINDLHSDISELVLTKNDLSCVSHSKAKFKYFKLTLSKTQFEDLFSIAAYELTKAVRTYHSEVRD